MPENNEAVPPPTRVSPPKCSRICPYRNHGFREHCELAILSPDSSFLHLSINEGASGDVDENKRAGKSTVREGIGCWCPKLEVRWLFKDPLTSNPSPPKGRGESCFHYPRPLGGEGGPHPALSSAGAGRGPPVLLVVGVRGSPAIN